MSATMIQLWAWEYEGKTFVGYQRSDEPLYEGISVIHGETWKGLHLLRNITNLRKVKVVDENAVVLSEVTAPELIWFAKGIRPDGSINHAVFPQNFRNIQERILAQLHPTPPVTKTYLTTDQFIKVYKSLSDKKLKELGKAWYVADFAAWNAADSAAWYAAPDEAWLAAPDEAWYADEAWLAAYSAAYSADLAILAKGKITPEQFKLLMNPWTSCDLSPFVEDWEEVLNPKVEEPKNFGAVVEADLEGNFSISGTKAMPDVKGRKLYKRNSDGSWQLVNTNLTTWWKWLINPTIISEGVEN